MGLPTDGYLQGTFVVATTKKRGSQRASLFSDRVSRLVRLGKHQIFGDALVGMNLVVRKP